MAKFITLYHFTDAKGFEGICGDRRIRKSRIDDLDRDKTDALYGDGVYFTDKSPNVYSKINIAKDIWFDDSLPHKMVQKGRTDFVITVKINKNAVEHCSEELHIWRYPGKDLDLGSSVVNHWSAEETSNKDVTAFGAAVGAAVGVTALVISGGLLVPFAGLGAVATAGLVAGLGTKIKKY